MNIFIPVFTNLSSKKVFDLSTEQNPGCGGTQHVSILLASRLAKAMPYWRVYLVHPSQINLRDSPSNILQKKFSSLEHFCNYFSQLQISSNRSIIPATLLQTLDLTQLKAISKGAYCWIHHPFFFSKTIKQASFLACVCVGEFQHLSVSLYYNECIFIQNIFPKIPLVVEDKNIVDFEFTEPLRIVHLGALVPAKGFLHIAKQWKRIKNNFPGVVMDVIGASSTYSEDSEMHPLIPTFNDFAERILLYIPEEDIYNKRIVFHGNLGPEKYQIINRAHFAIQNPTGVSEAFPASPLECMSLGTPVIASSAFGMHDTMKFFPQLVLYKPSQIVIKLHDAIASKYKYLALRKKSRTVAMMFAALSDVSTLRWIELITSPPSSRIRLTSNHPIFTIADNDFIRFLYVFSKTLKHRFFSLFTEIFFR